MSVDVAVVVCSRDRPDRLRECLASLVTQGAEDLLVVDSASKTGATRDVALAAGARCLVLDRPGLARARNAGMRATTADAVAFTDDDCTASPGWLAALCAALAEPRVGVVLGQVRPAGSGPPASVHLDDQARELTAADDAAGAGHGANLGVRRECWADVGGFDELLGVGARLRAGEDTDLLWRALHAGWVGRYEPAAVVGHEQWRGRLASLRTSYGYGVGGGAVRVKVRRLAGREAVAGLGAGNLRVTLAQAARDARNRYPFGVAVGATRTAGILTGRARAARLPLDHGHLQPR